MEKHSPGLLPGGLCGGPEEHGGEAGVRVCTCMCKEPRKHVGFSPDCCLLKACRTPWQPTYHHSGPDLAACCLGKCFVERMLFMPSGSGCSGTGGRRSNVIYVFRGRIVTFPVRLYPQGKTSALPFQAFWFLEACFLSPQGRPKHCGSHPIM